MDTASYREVEIALIDADANPRRQFDDRYIDELAASIREHGVIHAPEVRPKRGGRYDLIAGECRIRGAKRAGLPSLTVKVIEVSDAKMRERQLVENVHRRGLHALDEAAHFDLMIRKDQKTREQIAEAIGLSVEYVAAKLALLRLSDGAQAAFLAGRLSESHFVEVARIPPAFHDQAVRELLGEADFTAYAAVRVGEVDGNVEDGETPSVSVPLSLRQARAHLQAKYHLRLDAAGFDITDAALVPDAGACGPCPHNTANQPDVRPGLCANRPCFLGKRAAQYDRAAAESMRRGLIVLDGKDAAAVFDLFNPERTVNGGRYVDPADRLPPELEGRRGCETWGDLLGDAPAQRFLVRDGHGVARELVERATVMEAARIAGRLGKDEQPTAAESTPAERDEDFRETERKRAQRVAMKRKVDGRAIAAIVAKAEGAELDKAGVLRAFATGLAWLSSERVLDAVATRRELGKGGKLSGRTSLLGRIEKAGTDELRGIAIEIVATRAPIAGEPEPIAAMAEVFRVDIKAIEAAIKTEEKSDAKAKTAKKKTAPNLAAKGARK